MVVEFFWVSCKIFFFCGFWCIFFMDELQGLWVLMWRFPLLFVYCVFKKTRWEQRVLGWKSVTWLEVQVGTPFIMSQSSMCWSMMMMGALPVVLVIGCSKPTLPVDLDLQASNQINQPVGKPEPKIPKPNCLLLLIFIDLPVPPLLNLVSLTH